MHQSSETTPTTPEQLLVERFYYQGWNKADDRVMHQVLDANVEFRGSFRRKPLRGIPAFCAYMHQAHAALARNRVQIQDVVVSDNGGGGGIQKAAVRTRNRGVHRGEFFGVPGSGHEVTWTAAAFFTLHASKITEIWVLGDMDGLKHQIGASAGAPAFDG